MPIASRPPISSACSQANVARRRAPTAGSAVFRRRPSSDSVSGYAPDSWSGLVAELERKGSRSRARSQGRLAQERAARLLRFLPQSSDGADLLDDRRSNRLRRACASATPSRNISTPRPRPSIRRATISSRSTSRAGRRRPTGRSSWSKGTSIASRFIKPASRMPSRRWGRRSRPSKRPSCASMPSTSSSASTAMPPGTPLQPKPSMLRLRQSSTPVHRCASFCFPPRRILTASFATHGADAFRRLLEEAKPAIEFRIDAEIERLRSRIRFSGPAHAEGRSADPCACAARGMGSLARLRGGSTAGERRRPSE